MPAPARSPRALPLAGERAAAAQESPMDAVSRAAGESAMDGEIPSVPPVVSPALTSEARFSLLYWPLQLCGWGAQFWSQASGEVIFAHVRWSQAGVLWGGICLTGLGLTHALRLLARQYGWVSLPPRS